MLFDFFFGNIFGCWITFLVGIAIFGAIRSGLRAWNRRRRAMTANLARLTDARNAEARYALALVYAEGKKWLRALPLTDEAIAIAASDSRYNHVPHRFLRLRADCLYGAKDWAGAATAYRKALEVPSDAGYEEALLGVARSELRAGKWAAAIEFSKHAMRENESKLESYFRWAQAASGAGDEAELNRASEEFRRVASLLPPFARQRRLWWRLAFLAFPIARRIG